MMSPPELSRRGCCPRWPGRRAVTWLAASAALSAALAGCSAASATATATATADIAATYVQHSRIGSW
jgi:hypothetical protein